VQREKDIERGLYGSGRAFCARRQITQENSCNTGSLQGDFACHQIEDHQIGCDQKQESEKRQRALVLRDTFFNNIEKKNRQDRQNAVFNREKKRGDDTGRDQPDAQRKLCAERKFGDIDAGSVGAGADAVADAYVKPVRMRLRIRDNQTQRADAVRRNRKKKFTAVQDDESAKQCEYGIQWKRLIGDACDRQQKKKKRLREESQKQNPEKIVFRAARLCESESKGIGKKRKCKAADHAHRNAELCRKHIRIV